jgi:hypothetical protein
MDVAVASLRVVFVLERLDGAAGADVGRIEGPSFNGILLSRK